MKKQLSSIDLNYLVKELKSLEGSRIDKIYQPEKEKLIFSYYKSQAGKQILHIEIGKLAFLAEEKEAGMENLGFGMFLRKHLDNFFLEKIEQVKPERILRMGFKLKNEAKHLYVEFFGKGNAILCDSKGMILNALDHHEFKDRKIMPKQVYKYPKMAFNIFDLGFDGLENALANSKKDTLVTFLAVELGLGGIYAEEVCIIGGLDKNANPKSFAESQIQSILNAIIGITGRKIKPAVYSKDENIIDFSPFELEYYKSAEKRQFNSFSEAISFFLSNFREQKKSAHDKKLESLQRIIDEQMQALENLGKEEIEFRGKGELMYHNYKIIEEIISEINKASKKYSWKEIKEKLKGHKTIKEINEKDRIIIAEI